MYENRDLRDAYFYHGCSVVQEKDVLEVNIKGNSHSAAIKRWWYNLFLLSYSDKRSRRYYLSSHAMKVERAKHYRFYRNCIHPLSRLRYIWDCVIWHTFLINAIIFHHNTSAIFGELAKPFYYIAAFLEVIKFLDIFINLRTGYIDENHKQIVLESKKILIYYARNFLFLHAASAIPLQSIMFLRYGYDIDCCNCKCNMFVCILKLISIFSIIRIYSTSTVLTRQRHSFRAIIFFKIIRIFVLGLITMLQILNIVDTISLLDILISEKVEKNSFYWQMLYTKNHKGFSNTVLFCYELYRICKSLFLFGYGFRQSEHNMFILSFFIANSFNLWSLLVCYSYINQSTYPEHQKLMKLDRMNNMLRCRQLPDYITSRAHKYFNFNMTELIIAEKQNGLFLSLPISVQNEIAQYSYRRYITKIPYFSEWPVKVIDELVLKLKPEMHLKNDIISNNWTQGDGLVILDAGVIAVYSANNKEVGHLIDGDYFGELSLVTDMEIRMSIVMAVTNCKILILEKTVFRKFMRGHPKLFLQLKHELKHKYSNEPKVEGQI